MVAYNDIDCGESQPGLLHALRLKLFGPSKAAIWAQLAEQIEGRFQTGTWRTSDRVVADVGPWEVVLDSYTVQTGQAQIPYTRLRAPFVNADGFRFLVFRRHMFSGLAEWLGRQDVIVGDAEFDEQFIVRGNDEAKLLELFDNPRIRGLMLAQKRIRFEITEDRGLFRRRFPEGVDELRFSAEGVIKDIETLKQLFELFAETLNQLCLIGSAYEDVPLMPE